MYNFNVILLRIVKLLIYISFYLKIKNESGKLFKLIVFYTHNVANSPDKIKFCAKENMIKNGSLGCYPPVLYLLDSKATAISCDT